MDRKEKPRTKAGFTLLEMMVVLAIIGIGSAIAVTRYYMQIEEIKVRGDVRFLEQTTQVARMHAISENVPYGIVFNRDDKTYFIFRDNAPGPDGDKAFTDSDSNLLNNTDSESDSDDFIPDVRVGAGGNNSFVPHKLSNRNRFTCIFKNDDVNGSFVIIFDPMGQVTPNANDIGDDFSVVMIQTEYTGVNTDETKPRGFVHIDTNTGMTESILSQTAPTKNSAWCAQ